MKKYNVYRDEKYNHLYSEGVSRAFGVNKSVVTENHAFIASVQPLECDPKECGLVLIGTIEA